MRTAMERYSSQHVCLCVQFVSMTCVCMCLECGLRRKAGALLDPLTLGNNITAADLYE